MQLEEAMSVVRALRLSDLREPPKTFADMAWHSPQGPKSSLDQLLADDTTPLRYIHIRRETMFDGPALKGGATVAYQYTHKHGRMVRVSLALVNPIDSYDKFVGRQVSKLKFENGESIMLRVPKNTSCVEFLRDMFRHTI